MLYEVTPIIRERARKIGVEVRPSRRKGKKLDAYDIDGKYITSFGARGYPDYHVYKKEYGSKVADEKRRLYKLRHEKDRHVKYRDGRLTAGYLADQILW